MNKEKNIKVIKFITFYKFLITDTMIFGIIYGIILSLLAVFLITIAVKGGQMLYFFTRSEDTEVGLSYAGICIIHIIPLIYHRNNPVIMFIIAALVGNMLAGLLISTKKLLK